MRPWREGYRHRPDAPGDQPPTRSQCTVYRVQCRGKDRVSQKVPCQPGKVEGTSVREVFKQLLAQLDPITKPRRFDVAPCEHQRSALGFEADRAQEWMSLTESDRYRADPGARIEQRSVTRVQSRHQAVEHGQKQLIDRLDRAGRQRSLGLQHAFVRMRPTTRQTTGDCVLDERSRLQ